MSAIDWRGNSGYLFPDPDKLKSAVCGVCGSKMKVKRKVLGATSFAMAMAGRKRLHDSFMCKHYHEAWHDRIYQLKISVYNAECTHLNAVDLEKLKRSTAKEIRKLLKDNLTR